jgi:hypothetical protein
MRSFNSSVMEILRLFIHRIGKVIYIKVVELDELFIFCNVIEIFSKEEPFFNKIG